MPYRTGLFETYHPAVAAVCFGGIVLIGMSALHPVYTAVSLVGALVYCGVEQGVRALAAKTRWLVPLLLLLCVANPLFSASGSTELARVGGFALYGESLAFGACMGALLVSSVLWLEAMAHVLTADKILSTAGRRLPTVSLMASIAMGLVPQLLRRGRQIRAVDEACTCGVVPTDPRRALARGSTMLVSWALEDSLERADAMRARGWGTDALRTRYRSYELGIRDMLALAAIALLVAVSGLLAWVACSQWRFYPTMPTLVLWWGYLPYMMLVLVPTCLVRVR